MKPKLTLPRAYLRMSPNLDQHPDPGGMVILICAANRQPQRGRFRDRETLARILGSARLRRFLERQDIVTAEDGWFYVEGWDEWQEGDLTVGERQARIRNRREDGPAPASGAERTAAWRLRTKVFERDSFTCRYCGIDDYPREWLILEHVIPDGPTDEVNLVTACRSCNKLKGGRTPEAAGMALRDASHRSGDASPVTVTTAAGDGSRRAAPSEAVDVSTHVERRETYRVNEDVVVENSAREPERPRSLRPVHPLRTTG